MDPLFQYQGVLLVIMHEETIKVFTYEPEKHRNLFWCDVHSKQELEQLKQDFDLMYDFTPDPFDHKKIIARPTWDVLPDLHNVNYNPYSRTPLLTLNSNPSSHSLYNVPIN